METENNNQDSQNINYSNAKIDTKNSSSTTGSSFLSLLKLSIFIVIIIPLVGIATCVPVFSLVSYLEHRIPVSGIIFIVLWGFIFFYLLSKIGKKVL